MLLEATVGPCQTHLIDAAPQRAQDHDEIVESGKTEEIIPGRSGGLGRK